MSCCAMKAVPEWNWPGWRPGVSNEFPARSSPYGGEGGLSVGTEPPTVFRLAFTNAPGEQRMEVGRPGDDEDGATDHDALEGVGRTIRFEDSIGSDRDPLIDHRTPPPRPGPGLGSRGRPRGRFGSECGRGRAAKAGPGSPGRSRGRFRLGPGLPTPPYGGPKVSRADRDGPDGSGRPAIRPAARS
jgi:hypothetical protein